MRKALLLVSLSVTAMVLTGCGGALFDSVTNDGGTPLASQGNPNSYIVLFKPGVNAQTVGQQIAAQNGGQLQHVYTTAVNGIALSLPAPAAQNLSNDSRVLLVELDRLEQLDHHRAGHGGGPGGGDPPPAEELPTGIDRTEGDLNPNANGVTVNQHVAIIDSGIDRDHPDLNIGGGRNYAGGNPNNFNDGNGHGTHVAGTVGAIDNSIGVIGVAPGATVWGLRVCGNSGFCQTSDMIAAIDDVAACKTRAVTGSGNCPLSGNGVNFASANMSISNQDEGVACGAGATVALHLAICGLVNTGVVFVMSAGNDNRLKTAYPEAVAVSALSDFDGESGGNGSPTCRSDEDDTLANFSNYGPTIDIAAPGVCILSTWNDGGNATISGTSMASPHVAGAVALYLHANGQSPATNAAGVNNIVNAIIGAALPQAHACGFNSERAGQGSTEPLLFVNGAAFGSNGNCN